MHPPDHLINVMLALFCAVMGLIAGVLVALASIRAASSRTADMRKAWGSVAALVGLSWASLAIGFWRRSASPLVCARWSRGVLRGAAVDG